MESGVVAGVAVFVAGAGLVKAPDFGAGAPPAGEDALEAPPAGVVADPAPVVLPGVVVAGTVSAPDSVPVVVAAPVPRCAVLNGER